MLRRALKQPTEAAAAAAATTRRERLRAKSRLMQSPHTFRAQIVRHRSRRARMWNMGLLFLIYYCVSIYSAKGDEKAEIPTDVGMLPEAPDADIPTASVSSTTKPNASSEVSHTTNFIQYTL